MSKYQIAVVVGSLRKDSVNRRVADQLVHLARPEFSFKQLKIGDLPLYSEDDDDHPAESAIQFKRDINAAHGLLFVTPEYNRSIPGVLKNAIDHASRPYGRSAWAGKPAGVIGASPGTMGTAMAQQHLRNVLAYLDAPTLGQPEVFLHANEDLFSPRGDFGAEARVFLQTWMNRYMAWVKHHTHSGPREN